MKPKTTKLLLQIHSYLGLVCAPYLLLYGITGHAFNHGWSSPVDERRWEERVVAPLRGSTTLERALSGRDELGIFGHVLPWDLAERDGELHFVVARPGAQYRVELGVDGVARVAEKRHGPLATLRTLHGYPGADGLWARSWGSYTDLSLVVFAASLLTSIPLWWRRPAARRVGTLALAGGSLVTLSILVGLW